MRYIIASLLSLALALPVSVSLTVISASVAEARTMSISTTARPTAMSAPRATSVRSFQTPSRMTSPANGGSQAAIFAAATVAILSSQSHAAGSGELVRDPSSLDTFGVTGDISIDTKALIVAISCIALCVIIILGMTVSDHLTRRRYRY